MKGILWKRPYISVKIIEPGIISNPYQDYPAKMAFWNAVERGSEITVKMELSEDGKWYPI